MSLAEMLGEFNSNEPFSVAASLHRLISFRWPCGDQFLKENS
jgi:hypothetical protein